MSIPTKRLSTVDLLRAIAIFGVVAIHVPHWAPGGWRNHPFFLLSFIFDFGDLGVPLFVLISGFCIHLRASSQKRNHKQYNIDWKLFFQKSFYRIYPPYVVAIILSITCAYFLHSRYVLDGNSFLMDLVSHILLFHNLTVDYSVGLGNGAFWFLGMEAQIYLLYPILVWLIFRISYKFTWIVILIFTIAWRIYSKNFNDFSIDIFSLEIGDWSKWAFYYWVVWLLGAFSAEAYQENLKLPKWAYSLSNALIFLFFGTIFSDNTLDLLKNTSLSALVQPMSSATTSILHLLSDFSFIGSFFVFLNWLVKNESKISLERNGKMFLFKQLISELGKKSYSIYLVHVPVIYVLDELFDISFGPIGWLVRQFLYWITILGVSLIFFILVEKPSLRLAGRLANRLKVN